MTSEAWIAADDYLTDLLVPPDAALDAALERSAAAGLPDIQVAPAEGKLLYLLALVRGAASILEIGTLGGYSTIWLARGLAPGGRMTTIEAEASYAEVARANLEAAGVSGVVDVRTGRALDVLPSIAAEGAGPFDLVFLDADKPGNPDYLEWALRLTAPGSLIVADNVVRSGEVADPAATDASVAGTRRFLELVAAEPRLSATALQTVGRKGHDGFALALVTS